MKPKISFSDGNALQRLFSLFTLLLLLSLGSTLAHAQFAGGDGTEADPYLVATPEQLNEVRVQPDLHFRQTDDIALDLKVGQPDAWQPIGSVEQPFTGHFDGNGYAIVNRSTDETLLDFDAVFGVVADYSLTAIRFENPRTADSLSANGIPMQPADATNVAAGAMTDISNGAPHAIPEPPPVPVITDGSITIGTTKTGEMSATNTQDLYGLSVTQNGILELTLQGTVRTSGTLRLYDVDGKTQITSVSAIGRDPVTLKAGLYPGTYFVRIDRSQETWPYDLNSSLAAYPEDSEPDNVFEDATLIDIGEIGESFIGFYAHGFTDTNDWWKVTTEENGRLSVTLTSPENAKGNLRFYDVNGVDQLATDNLNADVNKLTATVHYDLKPGTYYIRVERTGNLWAYAVSTAFTAELLPNDPEPNNHFTEASSLSPVDSATGQLGYSRNGVRDNEDWWKVTATQDGILSVDLHVSDQHPGARASLEVWSPDWAERRSASLNVDALENTASVTLNNAYRPGTYWIKVAPTAGSAWSYTISSNFTPQAVPPQPFDDAEVLPLGGTGTGNIDDENTNDWWQVTTTQNGQLVVDATFSEDPGAELRLYDVNGRKQLAYNYVNGSVTGSVNSQLAPGTYYVHVSRYAARNYSYTLTGRFTPALLAPAPEPNNVFTSAIAMPLNGSVTGQLGYYSNNVIDGDDWWKITTSQNGQLVIDAEFTADPGAELRLYDVNGSKQLAYNYVNGRVTGNVNSQLAPGTYYVRVSRYAARNYSYTLASRFTAAPLVPAPEPNNVFTSAVAMPLNGAVTGQLGYYSNNVIDRDDWWKITTTQNGELIIDAEFTADPGAELRLYDVNGSKQLAYNYVNGRVTGSVNSLLAPGTYYVNVSRYAARNYSYTLTSSFTPAPLPADQEFNNHPQTATPIALGSQHTGHIYYHSNNWFDEADWYRVELLSTGTLVANLAANINPQTHLRIYDAELNQKASTYVNSFEPRSAVAQDLEAGTYYVAIERWGSSVFSYILSTTFTTGAAVNPQVISIFPASGTTVSIQDFVTATFSALMNGDTITDERFTLKDSSGVAVPGVVGYTGTVASFYPNRLLEVNKTYTATVHAGVQDQAGRAMLADYSWSFTVGSSDVDIDGYLLTVNKTGGGSGMVTSQPDGIACGLACMARFSGNTQVTLTANADSGSLFSGWSGPCTGTGHCTVTMNRARTVTANFAVADQSGSLRVNIEPSAAVDAGAQWRRTNTSQWQNSGYTEAGIPPGGQTVEFKIIDSWRAPNNAAASILAGQTTTLTRTYERATTCPYDDNLSLSNQTISSQQDFGACYRLSAGPDVTITASGQVSFVAGERIELQPGFRVQFGGRFTARIDSSLADSD